MEGVTMIEDITEQPMQVSPAEARFRTERQPPSKIRGVLQRTRPEFYKESGMLGTGTVRGGGYFEGYVPGASMGAHGNAQFQHAYSGSHAYPESGMMESGYSHHPQSHGYSPPVQGDYGTYTDNVLSETPDLPALAEAYNSPSSCVNVASHVSDCPVCTQLYSHDNTVLYVIIASLILIIVLLFMKLWERN